MRSARQRSALVALLAAWLLGWMPLCTCLAAAEASCCTGPAKTEQPAAPPCHGAPQDAKSEGCGCSESLAESAPRTALWLGEPTGQQQPGTPRLVLCAERPVLLAPVLSAERGRPVSTTPRPPPLLSLVQQHILLLI
ncbi:MAG: hypothetical protein ACT4PU_11110 [Planctomycetota bacterium]